MKTIYFIFGIALFLFFGCDNKPEKVNNIGINLELIQKFDSIVGFYGERLDYRYPPNLSIVRTDYTIFLIKQENSRTKELYLDSNGFFLELIITDDENEMEMKIIDDPNNQLVQKTIRDFIKEIQVSLFVASKIKRVDKMLSQDFLDKKQLLALKADLFKKENLYMGMFYSKDYSGIRVLADAQDDLGSQSSITFDCCTIYLDAFLSKTFMFEKHNGSSISRDCYSLDVEKYNYNGIYEISEDDLISFEESFNSFKEIINAKFDKLNL